METLKQTITRQDEELKQLTRKLDTLTSIVRDKMKQKAVEAKPLPVVVKSITEVDVLQLITEHQKIIKPPEPLLKSDVITIINENQKTIKQSTPLSATDVIELIKKTVTLSFINKLYGRNK